MQDMTATTPLMRDGSVIAVVDGRDARERQDDDVHETTSRRTRMEDLRLATKKMVVQLIATK